MLTGFYVIIPPKLTFVACFKQERYFTNYVISLKNYRN